MEKLEAVEERASSGSGETSSGKVTEDSRTKAEIAFEKVQEKRVSGSTCMV